MIGRSVNPPLGADRAPINIHPKVRKRLIQLLHEPEMFAVGYSEFIERACEAAETEIVVERRNEAARQQARGYIMRMRGH